MLDSFLLDRRGRRSLQAHISLLLIPLFFIFSPAIASFEPRDYRVVFVLQATARTDFGTGGFVYNSIMINGRDTPFIIGFIGDRLLVRSSKIERTTLRRE